LRESVLVDPWFLGQFGVNLYRGCEHDCIYCDGRAERYYVEGTFERDIQVKINALELVQQELKKRKEPGFLFLGGGVSDSYQPAEAQYRLARGTLKLAQEAGLGVHVLTKSALIERDFDCLQQIASNHRVILSLSLSTVDDAIRSRVEPKAASVAERLRLLEKARGLGLRGGIMAMPILPGLSDGRDAIDALVQRSKDAGAEFVCFGGLTLRPGRQKAFFYDKLRSFAPELCHGYDIAYAEARPSGAPDARFSRKITQRFAESLANANLPARIPRDVFRGYVPVYTEASVLLEHEECAARLRGQSRILMKSGHAIAQWAHTRLIALTRRKGFSYKDVEVEFLSRIRDGSLVELPNVSREALDHLVALGFGR
jgi:DNA repair photolyase